MKVIDADPTLAVLASGEFRIVRLTDRERSTLRAAGAILHQIRDHCAGRDGDTDITDIALAAHVCSELAHSGTIGID